MAGPPPSRNTVPRIAPASVTQDPRLPSSPRNNGHPPSAPASSNAQLEVTHEALMAALTANASMQFRLQQLEQGMVMVQHLLGQHDTALSESRASTEQVRQRVAAHEENIRRTNSATQYLETQARAYRQKLDTQVNARLDAFEARINGLPQEFNKLLEERIEAQDKVRGGKITQLMTENAKLTKLLDHYQLMFQESEKRGFERIVQLEEGMRKALVQGHGSIAIRLERIGGSIIVCNPGENDEPVESELASGASISLKFADQPRSEPRSASEYAPVTSSDRQAEEEAVTSLTEPRSGDAQQAVSCVSGTTRTDGDAQQAAQRAAPSLDAEEAHGDGSDQARTIRSSTADSDEPLQARQMRRCTSELTDLSTPADSQDTRSTPGTSAQDHIADTEGSVWSISRESSAHLQSSHRAASRAGSTHSYSNVELPCEPAAAGGQRQEDVDLKPEPEVAATVAVDRRPEATSEDQPVEVLPTNATGLPEAPQQQRPRSDSAGSVVFVRAEMKAAGKRAPEQVTTIKRETVTDTAESPAMPPLPPPPPPPPPPPQLPSAEQSSNGSASDDAAADRSAPTPAADGQEASGHQVTAESRPTTEQSAVAPTENREADGAPSSGGSRALSAKRPSAKNLQIYWPLIDELSRFQEDGEPKPRRTHVAMSLSRRDRLVYFRARAIRWSDYAAAARNADIIKLGSSGFQGSEWVALGDWFRTAEATAWIKSQVAGRSRDAEPTVPLPAASRDALGEAGGSSEYVAEEIAETARVHLASIRIGDRDRHYYPMLVCESSLCPKSFISRQQATRLVSSQQDMDSNGCQIIPCDEAKGQDEVFRVDLSLPYSGTDARNKALYERDAGHLELRGVDFVVVDSLRVMPGFQAGIADGMVLCQDNLERFMLTIQETGRDKYGVVDPTRRGLCTFLRPFCRLGRAPPASVVDRMNVGRKRKSCSDNERGSGRHDDRHGAATHRAPHALASRLSDHSSQVHESPASKRIRTSSAEAREPRTAARDNDEEPAGRRLPVTYGDLDEEQRRQCHSKTQAVQEEMEEARRRLRYQHEPQGSPARAIGVDHRGNVRDFDHEQPRQFTIRGAGGASGGSSASMTDTWIAPEARSRASHAPRSEYASSSSRHEAPSFGEQTYGYKSNATAGRY